MELAPPKKNNKHSLSSALLRPWKADQASPGLFSSESSLVLSTVSRTGWIFVSLFVCLFVIFAKVFLFQIKLLLSIYLDLSTGSFMDEKIRDQRDPSYLRHRIQYEKKTWGVLFKMQRGDVGLVAKNKSISSFFLVFSPFPLVTYLLCCVFLSKEKSQF